MLYLHIGNNGLTVKTTQKGLHGLDVNSPVSIALKNAEGDLEGSIHKNLSRSVVAYRVLRSKDPRSFKQSKCKRKLRKLAHQFNQKVNDIFWEIDKRFLRWN